MAKCNQLTSLPFKGLIFSVAWRNSAKRQNVDIDNTRLWSLFHFFNNFQTSFTDQLEPHVPRPYPRTVARVESRRFGLTHVIFDEDNAVFGQSSLQTSEDGHEIVVA